MCCIWVQTTFEINTSINHKKFNLFEYTTHFSMVNHRLQYTHSRLQFVSIFFLSFPPLTSIFHFSNCSISVGDAGILIGGKIYFFLIFCKIFKFMSVLNLNLYFRQYLQNVYGFIIEIGIIIFIWVFEWNIYYEKIVKKN